MPRPIRIDIHEFELRKYGRIMIPQTEPICKTFQPFSSQSNWNSPGFKKEYETYAKDLEQQIDDERIVVAMKHKLIRALYWVVPDGYAFPPHTVNVSVNNQCFFRCKMCDFGQDTQDNFFMRYNFAGSRKRKDRQDLPYETCKQIVDQSKWFRPIIRVSFVEPLLYEPLLPFLEYTKENGLFFWVVTNGFLLDKMASSFVTLGLDSIRVSLDGPQEIHDWIRGVKGSFRKAIQGIRMLNEEKTRQNKRRPKIGINFTLSNHNCHYIYDFVKTLDELQIAQTCDIIDIQWIQYTTEEMAKRHNESDSLVTKEAIESSSLNGVDIDQMDISEIEEQYRAVKREYLESKKYNIRFRPSFDGQFLQMLKTEKSHLFLNEDSRCFAPWYNLNLNSSGEAKCFHRCCLPSYGNLYEHEDIWELWNNETIREQRINLQKHAVYQGCARCWGGFSQS